MPVCYPKLREGYVSFAATFRLGRRKTEERLPLPGDHVEVLSRSLGLSEMMQWEEDFSLNIYIYILPLCMCVCAEQLYESLVYSHLLQEKNLQSLLLIHDSPFMSK